MRARHFPADRNLVPAHVTLFHALPPDGVALVASTLACFPRERFPVRVAAVRGLGRGVAFMLDSAELARRRGAVARAFHGRLTRQDGSGFRPHLTVQNKASPDAARDLLARLAASFDPETVDAGAFHLWRYRGGPWDHVLTVDLA